MSKKYTDEFKEEAVRLALEGKYARAQVARDLGVNIYTLMEWIRKHKEKTGQTGPSKTEELEAENRKLRRELDRATQERDILKKAIGIFSKELR